MAVVLTLLMTGCLLRSVQAGNAPKQFSTGMDALMAGDYAEAFCAWRPLADQGYAEAQYHLGWLYANGNGLSVDIEKALDFWRKAARQGHADAQFAIGLALTTGEGMDRDLDKAVDWYLKAARQGHQDAREILIRLNGDRAVDVMKSHPEVAAESWFGWTAEVTGARINVRGGPGTQHKIVAHLDKGARVRVVGRRGDWFMVVLGVDNNTGDENVAWIYKTLVSRASG